MSVVLLLGAGLRQVKKVTEVDFFYFLPGVKPVPSGENPFAPRRLGRLATSTQTAHLFFLRADRNSRRRIDFGYTRGRQHVESGGHRSTRAPSQGRDGAAVGQILEKLLAVRNWVGREAAD
jgi:hypothetical protein